MTEQRPNTADDIFFDGTIHDSQFAYLFQQADIPFWIERAKACGPKVLELACGTGRITIPVRQSGVEIDGLDFSESMLRVARDRAQAQALPVRFIHGDLRALPFQDEYDFIFLPSGTLSHLLSRTDLEAFLAGAHRALHATGVLALDLHNPINSWLRTLPLDSHPIHSTFQHVVTQEQVAVETVRHYASDTQILTIKHHYTFADGSTKEGTVVLRAYFPAELQALLHYNGFTVERVYGDYDGNRFQAHSRKYVVLARPTA